jgi:hypothetical protein
MSNKHKKAEKCDCFMELVIPLMILSAMPKKNFVGVSIKNGHSCSNIIGNKIFPMGFGDRIFHQHLKGICNGILLMEYMLVELFLSNFHSFAIFFVG